MRYDESMPTVDEYIREKIKAAVDGFHDAFGVARPGREPDYLDGRWCIKCHNSLPLYWSGPCDICGYEPTAISLEGLME